MCYYMDYRPDMYQIHIVLKGDTLWGLAQKYGVTVGQIKALYGLTSDRIYVDQYLRIREKRPQTGRKDGGSSSG